MLGARLAKCLDIMKVQLVDRIKGEFREMPGLKLTEAQVARLLSFDSALCSAVLTTLVDRHFLMRTRNTFQRAS